MGQSVSLYSMLLCTLIVILEDVGLEHVKIGVIFGEGRFFGDQCFALRHVICCESNNQNEDEKNQIAAVDHYSGSSAKDECGGIMIDEK